MFSSKQDDDQGKTPKQDTPIEITAKDLVDGDIVYGFDDKRKRLINLSSNRFNMDVYNDALISITAYSYPIHTSILKLLGLSFNVCPPELMSRAQDLDNFAVRFEKNVTKNNGYYQIPLSSIYASITQNTLIPFIKKRCKIGILWTLNRDKKIHFILDRINLADCFSKIENRYTYSEFRFIFRNWNYLKKYYDDSKLNFYRTIDGKLTRVAAPWEDNPETTKNYKPKNSHAQLYLSFFAEMRAKKDNSIEFTDGIRPVIR